MKTHNHSDALMYEPCSLELLEGRTLFSNPAPLPSFDDFEDPTNPALRLTTRYGEIDIELLANEVPALVNQFIEGLERGISPDQTFFHRLLPGIVLQGGLFGFQPGSGFGAFPVNLPVDGPVGSGRANAERTIAIGTVLDSGLLTTSSFIINLTDNSARWEPTEAVVFARILGDASWDVVQTIASLDVADLSSDPSFAGFFAGSFHNVPVNAPYTPPDEDGFPGTPITPELLATTYDLAITKDVSAPDFYRHTAYEPEGFLHSGVREFIPIENPHDVPVYYEINARFEAAPGLNSLFRDDLVFRGVIAPHSRGGATLVIGGNGIPSAVRRQDEPFALEIRSTLPLAASLSHYDLGSTIAMPFSDSLATTWYFPRAEHVDDAQDFIVWYNPGAENAEVTVTLIAEDGSEHPIVFQTDRFRRGGINFQTHPSVPEGVFAVRVDSTEPIAISRSHYALSGPPRNRPEGYSEQGGSGAPSTIGVLPFGANPGTTPVSGPDPTLSLSFYNPGAEDSTVTIELYAPGDPNPVMTFTDALVVQAGRAATFAQLLPQEVTDTYSVVFRATEAVFASFAVQRSEGVYGGAVSAVAANEFHFAEGFVDPGRAAPNVLEEALHIFNPNAPSSGGTGLEANITIRFRFSDGYEMDVEETIAAGTLFALHLTSMPALLEQALEHSRFYYSIEIISDDPIVAQMMHVDTTLGVGGRPGGGFIIGGIPFGETVRLDELG